MLQSMPRPMRASPNEQRKRFLVSYKYGHQSGAVLYPLNFGYATVGSFIQAGKDPGLLCVTCSLSTTLDLDIRRLVRLLQARNGVFSRDLRHAGEMADSYGIEWALWASQLAAYSAARPPRTS
jgi:hypothetical protein